MWGWWRSGRGRVVVVLALVAGLVPVLQGSVDTAATAAAPQVSDYEGPQFPAEVKSPTEDKPQSKLWFAYGSWWGLLVGEDADVHIYQLGSDHHWRDTGTIVDPRKQSLADVLWTGEELFVITGTEGFALRVSRYHFDSADAAWRRDDGFPVTVADVGPPSATIAEDSTGRLWTTYVAAGQVLVAHTVGDDHRWTSPFAPAGADTSVTSSDISSVVAFDGQIGVMWSDEQTSTFAFGVHRDVLDDDIWSVEQAASGYLDVDNQLNLQTAPSAAGTRVFAAVKSSLDEVSGVPDTAEQIAVLERTPDGEWKRHQAGSIADGHTRPILAVDSVNDQLYLISQAGGQGLIYKRSPLRDISFPDGPGAPLITPATGSIRAATSSKSPGTESSGLVVLATAPKSRTYYHAEITLSAAAADQAPPSPPALLTAEATFGCQVSLLWTPATDDVEVSGYVLERDGQALATVTGTTFTDTTAQCGRTVRYTVSAVDASGNTSAARGADPLTLPPLETTGIQLVGTSSATSGKAGQVDLPAPSAHAGDVVLASVDVSGSESVSAPAGWRLVRREKQQDGRLTKATFVWVAGLAEPPWYRFRLGSPRSAVAMAAVFRGVSTKDPVVRAAGQGNEPSRQVVAPSTAIDSPSQTAVAFFGVAGLVTITPPIELVSYMTQGAPELGPRRVTASIAGVPAPQGETGSLVATASRAWPSIGQVVVLRPGGE